MVPPPPPGIVDKNTFEEQQQQEEQWPYPVLGLDNWHNEVRELINMLADQNLSNVHFKKEEKKALF